MNHRRRLSVVPRKLSILTGFPQRMPVALATARLGCLRASPAANRSVPKGRCAQAVAAPERAAAMITQLKTFRFIQSPSLVEAPAVSRVQTCSVKKIIASG